MNNIIKLTDSLIGVNLPINADIMSKYYIQCDKKFQLCWNIKGQPLKRKMDCARIDTDCDLEVLGCITKDSVDDILILEYIKIAFGLTSDAVKNLHNYTRGLRSLIESKSGRTFINPLGEEPDHVIYNFKFGHNETKKYKEDLVRWKQAENNLLRKVVVLKIKK